MPKTPSRASQTEPSPTPDSATIEREREEFLRQFRAQLLEAHSENADSTKSACKVPEHRSGQPAIAEVCAACYSRLQESLDLCQSALQLDPKEAAQIVYDAVWADPSDPGRTYQNAANALLAELRKRAGMNTPLDPL